MGLHALMLLHDSRRDARVDENGEIVLLEDQDRARWDMGKVVRGLALLRDAERHRTIGPFQLQAAIASVHAYAPSWDETNWFEIRRYYDRLYAIDSSPVVALNRAVAIAFSEGFDAGLREVDALLDAPQLQEYSALYLARRDARAFRTLCRSARLVSTRA